MEKQDQFPRIPVKYIADIELQDEAFKPDFELTDKYQSFTSELLRLSLLGIAGYGFLFSEVITKNPSNTSELAKSLQGCTWLFSIGVVFLRVSAGAALAHRFFTTECLGLQIAILRHLKRKENAENGNAGRAGGEEWWSKAYIEEDASRINMVRERQKKTLKSCKLILLTSVVSLIIGAIAVAIIFAFTFFKYSKSTANDTPKVSTSTNTLSLFPAMNAFHSLQKKVPSTR